jgi:4-hydroxymandelate oxidase
VQRHLVASAGSGLIDLVELERRAASLLSPSVYDYFAGGADDETTLRENTAAWDRIRLRPRVLRDVSVVDTATTILGAPVATPVAIAPTAYQRLAHPDGEVATARGAAAAGCLHVLSTRATATPQEVEDAAPGAPRWFQVYVLRDRGRTEKLVTAALEAGVSALVLTADTPVIGRRLRDARNRFVLPTNLGEADLDLEAGAEANLSDQDPALTFDDIAWLRELAGDVPLVVKGVTRADDAVACLDAGAAAIWVSNHGGRQLDGCISGAGALPEVVDAVATRAEVYVDGGIRRGTDVLRALALGATAAFIGRPMLWGLTTAGAEGVRDVVGGLTAELAHAMALAGAPSVRDLTPDLIA